MATARPDEAITSAASLAARPASPPPHSSGAVSQSVRPASGRLPAGQARQPPAGAGRGTLCGAQGTQVQQQRARPAPLRAQCPGPHGRPHDPRTPSARLQLCFSRTREKIEVAGRCNVIVRRNGNGILSYKCPSYLEDIITINRQIQIQMCSRDVNSMQYLLLCGHFN